MSAVHLTVSGGMAELRLDNPAKLNALTLAMLGDLARHLDALERDSSLRGVILCATGEKAFCTGADINAWGDLSPADFARDWVRGGHRLFDRLARLQVPTIAVLQGHCFGGGLELAAACDLRVMAPAATLALPETGVGIVPGWSGTQRLRRLMPEAVVKEMALFGRRLTAERAHAPGLRGRGHRHPPCRRRCHRRPAGHHQPARDRGGEIHDPCRCGRRCPRR
ncbi:hypothetical protein MASR2M74_13040 [Paracoccaceae bacterium]